MTAETQARVCPDCGHYEVAHSTGGNCHGGPPGGFGCPCIRMRPIEQESPLPMLADKVAALETALAQILDHAYDTNDECRWCMNEYPDAHLAECPAAIAEVALHTSSGDHPFRVGAVNAP